MPRPFRPLQPLAAWVKGLAVVLTLVFLLFVTAFATLFGGLSTMESGQSDPDAPPAGFFFAFFAVFIGELLLFAVGIAEALVTGFWLMRAAENVQGRGVLYASWNPGWGIGSWFIPYGNMVLPFLVCREVWRGSQPNAPIDPGWKSRPVPAWMNWWWGLALGVPMLTMFAVVAAGATAAISNSLVPLSVLIIPAGLWGVALWLFLRFVQRLTSIQHGWVGQSV